MGLLCYLDDYVQLRRRRPIVWRVSYVESKRILARFAPFVIFLDADDEK